MGRDPRQYDQERTRWRAEDVRRVCDWLRLRTGGGLTQLLQRLGISYKRGREHQHSPDPNYLAKLADIQQHLQEMLTGHGQVVLLFEDECTYYRHPSLAQAYAPTGQAPMLAELGWTRNACQRIIAVLDPCTGAVYAEQHRHTGVREILAFYQRVCQHYPQARVVYLVQDNWPMHFHPQVLAALQPQQNRWPYRISPTWAHFTPHPWRGTPLPIQFLLLPTYASWTNPIEKLWRLLRQEVLHLHRFADDWKGLQERVGAFLRRFTDRSPFLLQYVGLSTPRKLYAAAFPQTPAPPTLRC